MMLTNLSWGEGLEPPWRELLVGWLSLLVIGADCNFSVPPGALFQFVLVWLNDLFLAEVNMEKKHYFL